MVFAISRTLNEEGVVLRSSEMYSAYLKAPDHEVELIEDSVSRRLTVLFLEVRTRFLFVGVGVSKKRTMNGGVEMLTESKLRITNCKD